MYFRSNQVKICAYGEDLVLNRKDIFWGSSKGLWKPLFFEGHTRVKNTDKKYIFHWDYIVFGSTWFDRCGDAKISDFSDSSEDEYAMNINERELSFCDKLLLTDISDLAEMCKWKCGTNFN